MVKLLKIQLDKTSDEIKTVMEESKLKSEKLIEVDRQFELVQEKLAIRYGEIAQAKADVENFLEKEKINKDEMEEKRELIKQLDDQKETQNQLISQFESELQKVVTENKELCKANEIYVKELGDLKFNIDIIKTEVEEPNSSA